MHPIDRVRADHRQRQNESRLRVGRFALTTQRSPSSRSPRLSTTRQSGRRYGRETIATAPTDCERHDDKFVERENRIIRCNAVLPRDHRRRKGGIQGCTDGTSRRAVGKMRRDEDDPQNRFARPPHTITSARRRTHHITQAQAAMIASRGDDRRRRKSSGYRTARLSRSRSDPRLSHSAIATPNSARNHRCADGHALCDCDRPS